MIMGLPQIELNNKSFKTGEFHFLIYFIASIFLAFPLLSPAVNDTVIYPYIPLGLLIFINGRFSIRDICSVFVFLVILNILSFFNLNSSIRLLCYGCSCFVLYKILNTRALRNLLYIMTSIHALLVICQFLLLFIDIKIDFSKFLRGYYGSLLPGTGNHIDYNSSSQFGISLPRVAGLSREPAFASILFFSLFSLAQEDRKRGLGLLYFAATLCSLSKIVFALIPSFLLAKTGTSCLSKKTPFAFLLRFCLFVAINIAILAFVAIFEAKARNLASLDASFFHRFIGLLTLATRPEYFKFIGSSWTELTALPEVRGYEFLYFERGFFDGNSMVKICTDLGIIALFMYGIVVAKFARSSWHVCSVALGGIFINLLSLSPSTVLAFLVFMGLYKNAPKSCGVLPTEI